MKGHKQAQRPSEARATGRPGFGIGQASLGSLFPLYEYVLPIAAACSRSACVQLVLAGRVMVAVLPPPGLDTL